MPNISQGIFDSLSPTQEGSLSRSKKVTSSCVNVRLTAGHRMTLVKTRLVGSKAVEETDGQLDPKLGEGGERHDRNQSNRFKDQTTGINPFYFPQLLCKMF